MSYKFLTSFNSNYLFLWNYKVITTSRTKSNKKRNKENNINYSKKEIQLMLFSNIVFRNGRSWEISMKLSKNLEKWNVTKEKDIVRGNIYGV